MMSAEHTFRVYVVLNPMAGHCDGPQVRRDLEQFFSNTGWPYTIYETTGQECLAELVRQMIDQGYDLFVAVGGDGTVSGVADGLAQTGIPLGIIPVGTGNALARELQIPTEFEAALQLLLGEHTRREIDALRIGQQFFVLEMSVGLESLLMRATSRWSKRRFGRLAYFWAGLKEFIGFQPERFRLTLDGEPHRSRAVQITVANAATMGATPFQWGPHIRLDDGRLDVCVIRARTWFDYLRLAWNFGLGRERHDPNVRYLPVSQEVTIESERPLPVQADGENIGQTPVRIQVVPHALRLIVPADPEKVKENE